MNACRSTCAQLWDPVQSFSVTSLRIPAVGTISVAVRYYFLFDVYSLTFCTESSAILTSVFSNQRFSDRSTSRPSLLNTSVSEYDSTVGVSGLLKLAQPSSVDPFWRFSWVQFQ